MIRVDEEQNIERLLEYWVRPVIFLAQVVHLVKKPERYNVQHIFPKHIAVTNEPV